uniref:ARID domain-containing protein n=2 Tax=Lotharella globosa TaxID=91324 RepID=A0A7S3ZAN8_9EUKA|eukprot:CAMPEP_0167792038 /NCGR_PEP_ID=MMETSP0111_2-20121227/12326_1 /TAXON_ID=91324 /ORGANISM="Lotharella globosa, Strain CCCM811" /LENGTH=279 /DNA_ID=CAMNT_0007684887 /DNA_START=108 /DNA_END=947 /DNA_ORIENTATION=-
MTQGKGKRDKPNIFKPAAVRASYCKTGTVCTKSRWLCCRECKKWRRISCCLPFESMIEWKCEDNADEQYNLCEQPEEKLSDGEVMLSSEEQEASYEQEQKEFREHVREFLKTSGFPSSRRPMLGGIELDLYRLYREVIFLGGYHAVISKPGTWSKIFRTLENSRNGKVTDASYRLKWYYTQSLFAYEQHFFHGKPVSSIQVPKKPKRNANRQPPMKKFMDSFTASLLQHAQYIAQRQFVQKNQASCPKMQKLSHASKGNFGLLDPGRLATPSSIIKPHS